MELSRLKQNWETLAQWDPLWAILSVPEMKGQKWDPATFFEIGEVEIKGLLAQIADAGFPLRRGTALDFGCGVGRLTQALCGHFERGYGVDISPTMLAEAARYNRFGPACTYVQNDSPDLRCFPSHTFDLIYTNYVLQHMPPAASKRYIAEFIRVLSPGGLAIFQLPSTLRSGEEPAGPPQPDQAANVPRPAGDTAKPRGLWSHLKASVTAKPKTVEAVPDPPGKAQADGDSPENLEQLIDMYGVLREEVIAVIERSGGTVVQVKDDENAGAEWFSYRYWVTKS
jgi:SAM-dependent methyltransferase